MKKVLVFLFAVFMVFGILLHSQLVLAEGEEDEDSSGDSIEAKAAVTIDSNSEDNSTEEKKEDSRKTRVEVERETKIESEESDDLRKREIARERMKIISRELLTKDNCIIKVQRIAEVSNGRTIEIVKKRIRCADGRDVEVKVRVENKTVDGVTRERIKYESDSVVFETEAEEGIRIIEESNNTDYKLKARLRNGEYTYIIIMPDRVSEIAIERLRSQNFTVELREVPFNSTTKAVYFAETDKRGKFLGFWKTRVRVETQIDPETGEVIRVAKPWWSLLVSGEDSDQTAETQAQAQVDSETEASSDTSLTLEDDEDGVLDTNESSVAA